MKQLSFWAKNHVWPARFLLAAAHLALSAWAIYGGFWLTAKGFHLPTQFPTACIAVLSVAVLAYPMRHKTKGFFRHSYLRQKSLDRVIIASGLLLLACSAQVFTKFCLQEATKAPVVKSVALRRVTLEEFRTKAKPTRRISGLKHVWQSAKTAVRDHARALKGSKLKWWQVGLVVLSVAVAIALLLLTVLLSCDLGCNGNQALAAVVFFGGIALTLALYVLAMRAIFRKTDNVKQGIIGGLLALIAAVATLLLFK